MAPSPTLYLFKAARRPLYRKENLQLLAAERGSVVDVSYNRAWVAPELLGEGGIRPGTRVVFVFTDRPHALFVPVRQGDVPCSCESGALYVVLGVAHLRSVVTVCMEG